MTVAALAQFNRLTVFQRAVRDRFREGGSATTVLLVLLLLAGVVLLVLILSRRARNRRMPEPRNEPAELFKELLDELDLSPPQRRLLSRVATDLQIEHPTVLVVCPALFDRHLATWRRRFPRGHNGEPEAIDEAFVRRLRRHLFPDVLARIGTRQMEWGATQGGGRAEGEELQ